MGEETEAKEAYLRLVREGMGIPKPKPHKRPVYWRGVALGKEYLRLQYAYLFQRRACEEYKAKLDARQADLHARIRGLYSDRDKIVAESYRRLSVQLLEALKASWAYDSYYKSARSYLFFLTAVHYIKGYEKSIALLPLLDPKASLAPKIPKGYENVRKRWEEDIHNSESVKTLWAVMWDAVAKALAVHRLPALLSLAVLGKEETLAFPEKSLEEYLPDWVAMKDIYDSMPSFFRGMLFPDWTELQPLKDKESVVVEALKRDIESGITSTAFYPQILEYLPALTPSLSGLTF